MQQNFRHFQTERICRPNSITQKLKFVKLNVSRKLVNIAGKAEIAGYQHVKCQDCLGKGLKKIPNYQNCQYFVHRLTVGSKTKHGRTDRLIPAYPLKHSFCEGKKKNLLPKLGLTFRENYLLKKGINVSKSFDSYIPFVYRFTF